VKRTGGSRPRTGPRTGPSRITKAKDNIPDTRKIICRRHCVAHNGDLGLPLVFQSPWRMPHLSLKVCDFVIVWSPHLHWQVTITAPTNSLVFTCDNSGHRTGFWLWWNASLGNMMDALGGYDRAVTPQLTTDSYYDIPAERVTLGLFLSCLNPQLPAFQLWTVLQAYNLVLQRQFEHLCQFKGQRWRSWWWKVT